MAEPFSSYRLRKLSEDTIFTLQVIETPEFRLRMWLGRWLIWMGVRVMGARFEFIGPADV